ncbi:MAG TPA: hypothetical protein VF418_13435 [Sphingomonadaceae bacterium]
MVFSEMGFPGLVPGKRNSPFCRLEAALDDRCGLMGKGYEMLAPHLHALGRQAPQRR